MKPIFYVEDNVDEVLILKRAFAEAGVKNPVVIASDGFEAIDYLAAKEMPDGVGKNPVPCLVLLDISLPGRSGLDVLKWMRSQPAIVSLPILMLTSSRYEADIHRAYLHGANGFLHKPADMKDYLDMVKSIRDFWLVHNRTLDHGWIPSANAPSFSPRFNDGQRATT